MSVKVAKLARLPGPLRRPVYVYGMLHISSPADGSSTQGGQHPYRLEMAPWLMNLLQQFGRDVITGAPNAVEGVKREYHAAKDPYLDKRAYWFRRGGEAEADAEDHRFYDSMTPAQKERLASLQASGSWAPFKNVKPKHRRQWTGAYASVILRNHE